VIGTWQPLLYEKFFCLIFVSKRNLAKTCKDRSGKDRAFPVLTHTQLDGRMGKAIYVLMQIGT
jgi:hypothetical protein